LRGELGDSRRIEFGQYPLDEASDVVVGKRIEIIHGYDRVIGSESPPDQQRGDAVQPTPPTAEKADGWTGWK
jgi:hypothetical protein